MPTQTIYLVSAIGRDPPESDRTFDWLQILKEAEEMGEIPKEDVAPYPMARH